MTIGIHVKTIGKKPRRIERILHTLPRRPQTLRQLIEDLVIASVDSFNARASRISPLNIPDDRDIADMYTVGKIAFCGIYSDASADPAKAIRNALQAFDDGLFRIFVNDCEITALDSPIDLNENDTITLIRLVMLTGGYL